MAVIKKIGKTVTKTTTPKVNAPLISTVSLPDRISIPSDKLGDYSILLYGEKKIGKTSLASKFKDAFFLMFEPGAKALSIFQRPVETWAEFKEYVKLLRKDKKFSTIVVDTVDIAYKKCMEYVCKKLVIDHPSDEGWGKGWEAIRNEFTSEINTLLDLDKGTILISHATEKEIKTRTGDVYHRISPTVANQAKEVLEGIVDIWAYYRYNGSTRSLVIGGDDHVGAGHRLEKRFKYTNGEPIREISMGQNAEEAFNNFLEAFNNKTIQQSSPITKPTLVVKRRKK